MTELTPLVPVVVRAAGEHKIISLPGFAPLTLAYRGALPGFDIHQNHQDGSILLNGKETSSLSTLSFSIKANAQTGILESARIQEGPLANRNFPGILFDYLGGLLVSDPPLITRQLATVLKGAGEVFSAQNNHDSGTVHNRSILLEQFIQDGLPLIGITLGCERMITNRTGRGEKRIERVGVIHPVVVTANKDNVIAAGVPVMQIGGVIPIQIRDEIAERAARTGGVTLVQHISFEKGTRMTATLNASERYLAARIRQYRNMTCNVLVNPVEMGKRR